MKPGQGDVPAAAPAGATLGAWTVSAQKLTCGCWPRPNCAASMTMPAGGIPGRRHPARLALAAQTLTAVGAVGADVADQIQADVSLAVAARRRTVARGPRPGRIQPALQRASWRVVPVGQVIQVRDGDVRRDVLVVAYVQSAGGARFIAADWLFGPLTVTAADDQGVSYQMS